MLGENENAVDALGFYSLGDSLALLKAVVVIFGAWTEEE